MILARLELTILYSASIRLIHLGHRTTVNNLFKKKKKNYSDDWFRSSDFWVMGPTRSLFATSLPPYISSPPYATLEGFEPSLPMGIALAGQRVNYSAKVSRSFHHLLSMLRSISLGILNALICDWFVGFCGSYETCVLLAIHSVYYFS